MGKSSKDKRDAYYRLAKEQGYRARSAYKLLQLDTEFSLLRPTNGSVRSVVDLCAAPGSWSQVLSRVLVEEQAPKDSDPPIKPVPLSGEEDGQSPEVKIVAVDLQPIAPLKGVTTLCADITHPSTVPLIMEALSLSSSSEEASSADSTVQDTNVVDLILSDGAPDVTGLHSIDTYLQSSLLLSALNLALKILKPGGTFVSKIFRAKDVDFIYARLRMLFSSVIVAKPRSSRASSVEAFVVCRGFYGPSKIGLIDQKGAVVDVEKVERKIVQRSSRAGTEKNRTVTEDGTIEVELYSSDEEDTAGTEGQPKRWIAPFLACGDLSAFDSDATYRLPADRVSLDPVQPPTMPPYKRALEMRRAKNAAAAVSKS
jgi:tRNA (cytidine32/guanosine34-2'-O)-methyltransferase